MNFGLRNRQISSDAVPASRIGPDADPLTPAPARAAPRRPGRRRTPSQPDQHQISGAQQPRDDGGRRGRVIDRDGSPANRSAIPTARGPTVTSRSTPAAAASRRARVIVAPRRSAAPSMSPSTATRRAGRARRLWRGPQRGAHRHRVRVVAVVDQRDPARRPEARSSPRPAESSSSPAGRAHPDRPGGGHGGEEIGADAPGEGDLQLDEFAGRIDLDPVNGLSVERHITASSERMTVVIVLAQVGRQQAVTRGHIRVPPGARPAISSALAAATRSTVPSSSRCAVRAVVMLTMTADVWLGDGGQLGDLAHPPASPISSTRPGCPQAQTGSPAAGRSRC